MMMTKVFYPAGIENIWHKSADGQRTYRLDSIEKIVRLKKLLTKEGFDIHKVNKGDVKLWNLIHTPKYISALQTGKPKSLAESSGIMWQDNLPQVYANSAKAMILACQEALSFGFAITLGKGGHHTVSSRGYGFGPVNEVAIAIDFIQKKNPQIRIAVLDTDIHIGNGWQKLLNNNQQVLLIDLWNKIIPKWKLTKTADNIHSIYINKASEYIPQLIKETKRIQKFKPDLLIYHCGLDILDSDRMGGLSGFTEDTLQKRESLVANFAKDNSIPTVLVTGGGYINHQNHEEAEKQFQHLVTMYKDIIVMFSSELNIKDPLL